MKRTEVKENLPPLPPVPESSRGEELFLTDEAGKKFYYWANAMGEYLFGSFKFKVTEHFLLRYLERFSPKSSPDRQRIGSLLHQLVKDGWLLDERLVRGGRTILLHEKPGFYLANSRWIVAFTVEDGICVTQTIYDSAGSHWYQNWLRFTERIYRDKAQTSKALRQALETKEQACG